MNDTEILDIQEEDKIVPSGSQFRPWIRLWARLFDIALIKVIMFWLLSVAYIPILVHSDIMIRYLAQGLIVTLIFVFIETYALFRWSTTPGKALLKCRIKKTDHTKLTLTECRNRSFTVWSRGLACGLPFISILTIFASYNDLKNHGTTFWDEKNDTYIEHQNLNDGRGVVAYIVLIAVFYFALRLP